MTVGLEYYVQCNDLSIICAIQSYSPIKTERLYNQQIFTKGDLQRLIQAEGKWSQIGHLTNKQKCWIKRLVNT